MANKTRAEFETELEEVQEEREELVDGITEILEDDYGKAVGKLKRIRELVEEDDEDDEDEDDDEDDDED